MRGKFKKINIKIKIKIKFIIIKNNNKSIINYRKTKYKKSGEKAHM